MYNVQLLQGAESLISSLYVKRQGLFLCCCFNYFIFSDTKFYLNGGISPTCFLFDCNQKEYMEVAVCDKSILEPLGFLRSKLPPGNPREVHGVASNTAIVLMLHP